MPYVDFHSPDDFASIFYTTNAPGGNVSGFDQEKPSIIILHPFFLDSSWLDQQFGDPRLNKHYNIVAFDMRTCGRSRCRPSAYHDSWVEAADLAFCHQALHLPPCHILAFENISINCALRFAVLFPEMCLSLTLCNIPAPTEQKWIITAFDELSHDWSYSEDLESFERVMRDCAALIAGPDCGTELRDELIAYWETCMPPSQMLRIAETISVSMNRIPLESEVYSSITQPVLLINGENQSYPKRHAEKLASQLTNAKGGTILYTVKGGSNALSIVPGHASIANQVFAKFLSRLPRTQSHLVPPDIPLSDRMKLALSDLADITGTVEIASRNPLSSLSFSCLPSDIVMSQTNTLREYRKSLHKAFSPLGPDGRPLRKYSDKVSPHWFHGGQDGLSIAGTALLPPERTKDPERREKMSTTPPHAVPSDKRLRRATFTTNSVEKVVIKGSMAKVVGNVPTGTFHRLMV